MNEKEYLEHRLQDQINWYDKKADEFKTWHDWINIGAIACSTCGSLITILSFTFEVSQTIFTILGAIASSIVAIAISIDKLKRFGELHVIYRKTCESLKRELYLYQTKSSEYHENEKAFNLLVERCESIMATENGSWVQLNEKKKD